MYERILVPLDGSGRARTILPHVEALASRFSSEVILLEVVTSEAEAMRESATAVAPELGIRMARDRVAAEAEAAKQRLRSLKGELRAEGYTVTTRVLQGAAAPAIVQEAENERASLICMATRGRGGLGRMLFGSVADEVLRHSPTPVLLVRVED